mgnify:CR=1 FL=1
MQQEQVHFGDAELDMLALGRELPLGGGGDAVLDEGVGLGGAGEELSSVHPGPQRGGPGHVGRGGQDPVRQRPAALGVPVKLGDDDSPDIHLVSKRRGLRLTRLANRCVHHKDH